MKKNVKIEEKLKNKVVAIHNFDEFKNNYVNHLVNKSFIFRGCCDLRHKLVPGFLRKLHDERKKNDDLLTFMHKEDKIFHDFAANYVKRKAKGKNDTEHINLMHTYEFFLVGQHYGFQTKLLDFTKDINVALAFVAYDWSGSTSKDKENGVLYVLDKNIFLNTGQNISNYDRILSDEKNIDNLVYGDKKIFDNYSRILLEPNSKSKSDVRSRISIQSGLFVYFKDFDQEHCVIKDDLCFKIFEFDSSCKPDIKKYLKEQVLKFDKKTKIDSLDVLR